MAAAMTTAGVLSVAVVHGGEVAVLCEHTIACIHRIHAGSVTEHVLTDIGLVLVATNDLLPGLVVDVVVVCDLTAAPTPQKPTPALPALIAQHHENQSGDGTVLCVDNGQHPECQHGVDSLVEDIGVGQCRHDAAGQPGGYHAQGIEEKSLHDVYDVFAHC